MARRPYSLDTYAAMTETQLRASFAVDRDLALDGESNGLYRVAMRSSVRAMLAARAAVAISGDHQDIYDEACDLLAEVGMDEASALAYAAERDARHATPAT